MAIPYTEDRDDKRFGHISTLQVEDLSSGAFYEARMQDYSNGGIYFESDGIIQKGAKIYICMQHSPYPQSYDILEYFTAEIKWRKNLKQSFFDYGYGVQFVSGLGKQDSHSNNDRKGNKTRKHSRKPFCRTIQLSTHKEIFKGRAKNISASGVFITAEKKIELGQVLKLSLPYKDKTVKTLGQIVWLNDEGFGLKFKKIK